MSSHPALLEAVAAHGLQLRGHWLPGAADRLQPVPDGQAVAAVWMVGVVGSTFWPHFKASPCYSDGLSDPLDRWSNAIAEALAKRFGGYALYPFEGPPYHPFQQWADRAEATQTSAMLLRIHPKYGLWHAYRFALALPLPLRPPAPDAPAAPASPGAVAAAQSAPARLTLQGPLGDLCARCTGQPCLQACPVQAYAPAGFALQACAGHLRSGRGDDCMQRGCLARRACPVAAELRYTPEHAAFHMRAFSDSHSDRP
jgi:hypothetical protein